MSNEASKYVSKKNGQADDRIKWAQLTDGYISCNVVATYI